MIASINQYKFKKALVEVDAILEELSMEEYNKIPEEVISCIDEIKDKNYNWEYDYNKEFENQNFSEYTLEILAYINGEYLLNNEQKKIMEQFYELNEEKEKLIDNNIERNINKKEINVFENRQVKPKEVEHNIEKTNNDDKQQLLPIVVNKKDNIFTKIISVIKKFFRK